jgi:hypothetical protein
MNQLPEWTATDCNADSNADSNGTQFVRVREYPPAYGNQL